MKTVKVRVAVAVNEDGSWNAYGYCDNKGRRSDMDMLVACEGLDLYGNSLQNFARYWITAELPISEVQEIPAKVENDLSEYLGKFVTAKLKGAEDCQQGWVVELNPFIIEGVSKTKYECEGIPTIVENFP